MLKRFGIALMIICLCAGIPVSAFAADNNYNIILNDKLVDMPAAVWDGELFIPLRSVCEALGFNVAWSGKDRKVIVGKPDTAIQISLNESKMMVNDHEMYIIGGYRASNGHIYMNESFYYDNLGLTVKRDSKTGNIILKKVKQNPVMINTKKEVSDVNTLKISLQYPVISGLKDTKVQDGINSTFEKLALAAREEGLQNEKNIREYSSGRDLMLETYFNYQVKYNAGGMLSVVFYDYQYSGGAHGMTVQSSYTFDLETGSEYKLNDLFDDKADYISLISSEIKKQMKDKGLTVLNPFTAIKADQDFYISNGALVVYFQEYEYLPYAYGIPEFSISLENLKNLIKTDLYAGKLGG